MQHTELSPLLKDENSAGVDYSKLKVVAKNGFPWIIGIIAGCFLIAYLAVRYTKPVFESYSELKLDHEDQSNFLGFPTLNSNNSFGLLSSEMELIKSRLFFSKIIENVRLNPQYYTYGNFLNDEKYRNPPFQVNCQLKSLRLYDVPIDLIVINRDSFELRYEMDHQQFSFVRKFNNPVKTPHLAITATLSPNWSEETSGSKFYFVINSHSSLINYIEDHIQVEPLNLEANTFRISFRDHNVNKAHDLVRAIDTLYYQYSLQEKNKANRNKIDYLNDQLKETENKLDDFEDYFEKFTISNKTVNLDKDVKHTIDLINDIDSQRVNLKDRLKLIERVHQNIVQEKANSIVIDPGELPKHLSDAIDELNLRLNEKEKLAITYKSNTYTYKSLQKEVDLLKSDLMVELTALKSRLYEQLNELTKQKAALGSKLMKLPSKSTEYNKAKRFYSLYEEIYLSLMQSKNEFEIAVAGSTTKIKILSPASFPSAPIYPNKVVAYGTASALALVLAFIFLSISYMLHDKISSVTEIEKLTSIPVLGSIPEFPGTSQNGTLLVENKPKSAVSESLRTIRTNLEFMLETQGSKIYSITSTISSEGKTFITTNLGALIAMTGKKVVILDLDLRKPKVHLSFGDESSSSGVSTLLIGKHKIAQCLRPTHVDNLQYIAAGPIPPNPSELLLRETFEDLLFELQKKFDVVLLDTPPVGLVTDGLLAMQKSDLPIYVLRANYSKKAFIENINRILKSGKFDNLSIVFNASTTSRSDYGYRYGYGRKKNAYYEY